MALAIGFAYSEGLISSTRDVALLQCCDDDPAVRMRLARPPAVESQRSMIVSSSCGVCGVTDVEGLLAALQPATDTLHVTADVIQSVLAEMKSRQVIFSETGGTHAAALFSDAGEIVSFAEDIGRHNALDKAIGACLLEERPTAGLGVALSGRVSFELVAKAARAGLELIAAVSAPTSLAVDAAEKCNITLCGFVRGDRMTVYCHPRRVRDAQHRGDSGE